MKQIIPRDTRYTPLVQQKSCCVPTSISMVMYRLGLPLLPQELLGYHLGLIVSPKSKNLFWNARSGPRPKAGYGTQISKRKYSPNYVFKKLGIPLELVVHPVGKFKTKVEFTDFVVQAVKKDKDILACFNHGVLSGDEEKSGGHVCVVDRVYPKKGIVRLVDPSPNEPKWREVKIARLKFAMERHPSAGGGFWELKNVVNRVKIDIMLDRVKKFVDDLGQSGKHGQQTIYWLKKLYPATDEAMEIAAYAHDAARQKRSFSAIEYFKDKEFSDPAYLEEHQKEGALMIKEFLLDNNYPPKEVDRVYKMIRLHEVGGDWESDLIRDADSLSFFEVNVINFIDKYTYALSKQRVRNKIDWMFGRISSPEAKDLAINYYQEAIQYLDKK